MVNCSYMPASQFVYPYNAQNVANDVIENVKPGDIFILHDGNNDHIDKDLETLETILIKLKKQGYKFVRIDDIH